MARTARKRHRRQKIIEKNEIRVPSAESVGFVFSKKYLAVEKSVNEGNTGNLREKREITEFNELRRMVHYLTLKSRGRVELSSIKFSIEWHGSRDILN